MISETKIIETRDKTKLHCEMIENGSPVWIIVTHGLGEHCRRHSHFFKMFSQHFSVCLYDLRGHGDSEGERANVEYFDKYVDDLEDVIQFLKDTYDMKRHIVFGHSMGGGGAIQCALKNKNYYKSVSAFSPICSLHKSDFAQQAIENYFNNDESIINYYDPIYLIREIKHLFDNILIDVGLDDEFLKDLFNFSKFIFARQNNSLNISTV